jgi:hypothetical protein
MYLTITKYIRPHPVAENSGTLNHRAGIRFPAWPHNFLMATAPWVNLTKMMLQD